MPSKKNPQPKLAVPAFATEKEEAQWWDRNMDQVEELFTKALRKGALKHATAAKLASAAASKNITIRMAIRDIERCRHLAQLKGIGYQTYLKMLLREALDREVEKAG